MEAPSRHLSLRCLYGLSLHGAVARAGRDGHQPQRPFTTIMVRSSDRTGASSVQSRTASRT